MKREFSPGRRRILHNYVLGAAGFALLGALPDREARASEDLPKVSLDDPTAKQLAYTHDADADALAERKSGEYCYNCRYFKGDESTDWAKCDLFPGKLVNSRGWCNVYASK